MNRKALTLSLIAIVLLVIGMTGGHAQNNEFRPNTGVGLDRVEPVPHPMPINSDDDDEGDDGGPIPGPGCATSFEVLVGSTSCIPCLQCNPPNLSNRSDYYGTFLSQSLSVAGPRPLSGDPQDDCMSIIDQLRELAQAQGCTLGPVQQIAPGGTPGPSFGFVCSGSRDEVVATLDNVSRALLVVNP